MEHHVPSAVVFAKQEQRRLIDAIRDAIIGDITKRPTQASGRHEQISEVQNVHRVLVMPPWEPMDHTLRWSSAQLWGGKPRE